MKRTTHFRLIFVPQDKKRPVEPTYAEIGLSSWRLEKNGSPVLCTGHASREELDMYIDQMQRDLEIIREEAHKRFRDAD